MGAKRHPPTTPRGGAASSGPPALPPQLKHACREFGHVPLIALAAYVLLAFALPWLADLTPPGVNMSLVAEETAAAQHVGGRDCEHVCDALSCPAGWTTSISPTDACKCICKRMSEGKLTAWDLEQQAKHPAGAHAAHAVHAAHETHTAHEAHGTGADSKDAAEEAATGASAAAPAAVEEGGADHHGEAAAASSSADTAGAGVEGA
mmetsp:Transcript_18365/g.48387  ORF Transcript_18365/g.48387 Transcript_18365/m.48387 type:complete len:206 (+) Transcript_18365:95-712(+)|eukprot:7277744-Prymnesium_polylepis.1